MDKDLKILMLKQACEDIKTNAEDIIGSTKYNSCRCNLYFLKENNYG